MSNEDDELQPTEVFFLCVCFVVGLFGVFVLENECQMPKEGYARPKTSLILLILHVISHAISQHQGISSHFLTLTGQRETCGISEAVNNGCSPKAHLEKP